MENYAIIENGIVINAIAAEADFAAEIGAILLPDGFGIGDKYDGKNFAIGERPEPPAPPEPEPLPPPEPSPLEIALAELAEKQERDKLETQLALAEIAEIAAAGGVK